MTKRKNYTGGKWYLHEGEDNFKIWDNAELVRQRLILQPERSDVEQQFVDAPEKMGDGL